MNDPETFMERFIGPLPTDASSADTLVFHPDAVKEYVDQMREMQGVHGMCEDYRAGASVDLDEQRADIKQNRRIQCPVFAIWGAKGLVAKKFDVVAEWKKVSDASVQGEAVDSGHYIPEELPDMLLRRIKDFFQ
jgi:haloacetate dehalogenase